MAGSDTPDNPTALFDEDSPEFPAASEEEQRRIALEILLDAWDEGLSEGIEPDVMAQTAIFAALSDMVDAYGEEPVAKMAEKFATRVRSGEFTLNRTLQ